MASRWLLSVLILVLWPCWPLSSWALAGDPLALFGNHSCDYAPHWTSTAKQYVARPTRPHGFSVYNVSGPYYGSGFGVPTFNWGYFGARYRMGVECHQGYYGTFTQWGFRRGY